MRKLLLCSLLVLMPNVLLAQKQGQERIDSLITALPSLKEDTNTVLVLNELSNLIRDMDTKEAMVYGERTLALAQKINWQKGIGNALVSIGNVYHVLGDYTNTLKYYKDALKVYQDDKHQTGVAQVLGNIGLVNFKQGKFAEALNYHFKALRINEALGNKKGIVINTGNIGLVYVNLKDYKRAIEYELKALKVAEEINDKRSMALNMLNIGNAYNYSKNHKKALEYSIKAREKYGELENRWGEAMATGNIGTVHQELKNYNEALKYCFMSLRLYEEMEEDEGIARNNGNIGSIYLYVYTDSSGKKLEGEYIPASKAIALEKSIEHLEKAVALDKKLGIINDLQEFAMALSEAYGYKGRYKEAFENHKLYATLKDSIFTKENTERIAHLETERQLEVRQKQIELDKLTIAKKKNERIFFIMGITGLLVVIVLMARVILLVSKERKKSDQLLLNILPTSIADRLKRKEHPIADNFQSASILFVDIANFTTFSETRDPKDTVNVLNTIFTEFDHLAEQYGLEKIKTIGDCYMAACGLPEPRPDHVIATLNMALAVKEMIRNYRTHDGVNINFRLGLDCGPVVAGVIGKKKFIYDLWGDAVNTASRMESSGVVGEIHCTDRFKEMAGDAYNFTSRGIIEIKGKGKMQTWLVDSYVLEVAKS